MKKKVKLSIREWSNFQKLMQFSFSIRKIKKSIITIEADIEKLKEIGY